MKRERYSKAIGTLGALLMALYSTTAFAQSTVTGTVKDKASGAALSGVSVTISGASVGTVTSAVGRYSITIPAGTQKSLVFNALGYAPDTVAVGTRSIVDVALTESATALEEVVAVGYGTMRRTDIAGSSVSVKINEQEAATITSFDKLLQGRAAGVQVTTGSSAPAGAVSIVIRGASSFNSSSQPLYVVDGVVLGSSTDEAANGFRGGTGVGSDNVEAQNPLAAINPNDIQSIEVLKDASSTAIYGSQGANGVVLITTKQGATSKPKIDFSTTLSFSQRSKKLPMLNTKGFAAMRNELGQSRFDPDTTSSVDWQDYSMRTGVGTNNLLGISGRTDATTYYMAVGFNTNNGVVKQTNSTIGTMRVSLETKVNKVVTLGTKSTFSYINTSMLVGTDANGAVNNSLMRQIISFRPYWTSGFDPNDPYAGDDDTAIEGPYTWFSQYDDKAKESRLIAVAYADEKILPWLSYRLTGAMDFRSKVRERFYGLALNQVTSINGRGNIAELRGLNYNVDNMFNFNKTWGRHRLSGVVGVTIKKTSNENITNQVQDFTNSLYRINSFVLGNIAFPAYYDNPQYQLLSYLGRGTYSFNNRYILTATFRADGSSKFSKENRFSYFPSFAFAWRASEENFLKNNHVISNLKFRVGWGQTGNQGAVAPYQTLATYTSSPIAVPGTWKNILTGYTPSGIPNPGLKWETSQQTNIGLDFGLFKERITGVVDIYRKETKDLLQQLNMAISSGSPSGLIWANQGSIQNQGVEVSLDVAILRSKKLNWNVGGNVSFNRNKITDSGRLPGQWGSMWVSAFLGKNLTNSNSVLKTPANIFIQGQPLGLFWGYKTDGIIQAGDTSAPVFAGAPTSNQPGNVKYVDISGPNNLPDGQINNYDMTIIGNPNPKMTYGFYTSLIYGNWSLNLNFNGVYGNNIMNANLAWEEFTSATYNVRRDAYFKAWRPDAPNNDYPALGCYPDRNAPTDRLIEDGSFLRLSNASLAYRFTFPAKWIVKSVNVSFTANNLFCISKYKGWDPEVNSFTNDPTRVGIDWGSYPGVRSYIGGLMFTF